MFEEDFVTGKFEQELEKLKEKKKKDKTQNKENKEEGKKDSEKINFWDIKKSIYEKNKQQSNCIQDFLN